MNQQLEDYIKQARQSGKTDDQIRQELLNSGWSSDDIKQHMALNEINNQAITFGTRNSKLLKIIGVSATIFIASAGFIALGFYFYFFGSCRGSCQVTPEKVNLSIDFNLQQNNEYEILLELTADLPSNIEGCQSIESLEANTNFEDKKLIITMGNLKYINTFCRIGFYFPGLYRVRINKEWLVINQNKDLVVKLKDFENQLSIYYDLPNNKVIIKPIHLMNVDITNFETTLYPSDVWLIYSYTDYEMFHKLGHTGDLSDSYTDFRSMLKEFAKAKNLTLASEVYKGFETEGDLGILVVSKDKPMISSNDFGEFIGKPYIMIRVGKLVNGASAKTGLLDFDDRR